MPFDLMSEIEVFARVETRRPIGPVEQTLIEARELISNEDDWGRGCGSCAPALPQLCVLTAIAAAGDERDGAVETFNAARGVHPSAFIGDWNDAPTTTHADVMSAFDRAIALAASEGA